jgi:hypothetical protein
MLSETASGYSLAEGQTLHSAGRAPSVLTTSYIRPTIVRSGQSSSVTLQTEITDIMYHLV